MVQKPVREGDFKYMKPVFGKKWNVSGQAAVEMVLLLHAFTAVILILVNVFLAAYNQLVVIEAANEAARTAEYVYGKNAGTYDAIRYCADSVEHVLSRKLKNATFKKPEISFEGTRVTVKISCSYRLFIPLLDRVIDEGIELTHTAVCLIL